MKKLLCAFAFALASIGGSSEAATVKWLIQFGGTTASTANEVHGTLEVLLDTSDVRVEISDLEFDIVQWFVTDFTLTIGSQKYEASAHRLSPYPGAYAQEVYDRQSDFTHPRHLAGMDLDLEGGATFDWRISSQVGLGGDELFQNGDPYTVISPIGTLADYDGVTGGISYLPNGSGTRNIISWTEMHPIPLPASLPLLLASVAGLGYLARRKKKQD